MEAVGLQNVQAMFLFLSLKECMYFNFATLCFDSISLLGISASVDVQTKTYLTELLKQDQSQVFIRAWIGLLSYYAAGCILFTMDLLDNTQPWPLQLVGNAVLHQM